MASTVSDDTLVITEGPQDQMMHQLLTDVTQCLSGFSDEDLKINIVGLLP